MSALSFSVEFMTWLFMLHWLGHVVRCIWQRLGLLATLLLGSKQRHHGHLNGLSQSCQKGEENLLLLLSF